MISMGLSLSIRRDILRGKIQVSASKVAGAMIV
uniref:Uncharacterized protein n=1 Tax=Anguilla anguilla TaxID=7936 RepID=A0A0E9VBC5_ANGAN